jgi:hypothetical protein
VIAAKGAICEGQAMIARLEKETIVVAADATVEGSEPLRCQFSANAGLIIDLKARSVV